MRKTSAAQPAWWAGLARACHPAPTVAVSSLAVLVAAAVGVEGVRIAVLGLAVLAGQLTVGWLNDLVDRDRDRTAGRTDKPVASGVVTVPAARLAVAVAAVACVALSLTLGWRPGTVHLLAVAAAWAYNLGLKSTSWSWLPYAAAFGLLPSAIWLAAPGESWPPWWIVAAGALLGVGAHGANVLPDLADDEATGVTGLPHRLPLPVLRIGTAAGLLAALTVLTVAAPGQPDRWELAVLATGTVLAGLAAGVPDALARGRRPMLAAIGVAALAVLMLVARSAAV